jgi:hypothetical protein
MNEKPGLEPGFFLLDELAAWRASACLTCRFEIGLAKARKRAISYRHDCAI